MNKRESRKRRAHGEGSLLKRKGCALYYAQWYKDGRQFRVSTGTAVKQEALGVLRKLMGDSERGLVPLSELKKVHYADLRAALLTNYVERGNRTLETRANGDETIVGLPQLDAFMGFTKTNPGPPVTKIGTDLAREFVKQRQAEGAGPAMINRSLQRLHRMLVLAHEDGKLPAVPKIRLLKEPPARKGFLEVEKFNELLRLLPTHLRPLILFLYYCGVRLGEARQIEWPQVNIEERYIRLEEEQAKTGEARTVPLPAQLVMLLREIKPKTGLVFDASNLRTEWARACAACGLGTIEKVKSGDYTWERYSGLIVHDLRRSAVRNLVNAGVPERVAMSISGHKTRAVFDRYHIVSPEDVLAAMRKVETANLANGANLVQTSRRKPRKLLRPRSSDG